MREMLRTILVAVLIVMLIGFSVKFLKTALTLVFIAIPIVGILYLIRRMTKRKRSAVVEEVEPSRFDRKYPKVARLERRIRNLESVIVEEGRKG